MTIFEIRAVEKGVLSGFSSIRDYSFSTCAKFSKKLTFLTPWYEMHVSYVGGKKC